MFASRRWDRTRQLFADQFERDGAGFTYRKGMKSAPVQVSAAERDRAISAFNERLRLLTWILTSALLVLVIGVVAVAMTFHSDVSGPAIYLGTGLIAVAFLLGFKSAWNAPARMFRGRMAVGGARSRSDVRRRLIANTSWGQLGATALGFFVVLLDVAAKHDVTAGWNRLWLVGAVIGFAALGVQAFLKWRS